MGFISRYDWFGSAGVIVHRYRIGQITYQLANLGFEPAGAADDVTLVADVLGAVYDIAVLHLGQIKSRSLRLPLRSQATLQEFSLHRGPGALFAELTVDVVAKRNGENGTHKIK